MSDPNGEAAATERAMLELAMPRSAVDAVPSTVDARIGAAAQGDRAAAQSLLTELLPRVRNLVRYLVRGDALVDDITQQVLLELLRSFGSYRSEGTLHAWVHRITVRVTLRQAALQRRHQQRQQQIGVDLERTRDDDRRPDEYLRRRQAVALLDVLPDEQRTVLVMHHVVGMSVPELADTLKIPFETARSRLRLAMNKLRELTHAQEDP